MSLFHFLKRLPKRPYLPTYTISLHSPHHNHSSTPKSNPHPKTPTGFSPIHLLGPRNYCTDASISSDNLPNTPNADPLTHQTAENICKIISIHNSAENLGFILASCPNINLSPPIVLEVLKKLSNAGLLALSFFKWADKQHGFKHTTDTYNALIESLGKIKQFKLIWDFVDEMSRKRVLTKDTFALICRRYARARRVKEAVEAFERMEKFDLKPELSDFNRLIDTLSKSRQVESAHQVFDKWKGIRFRPDIKSYTILLEGWGREKNLLRLDETYREMKGDGFEPDVVTYGILINGYCKANKYDEAIKRFDEMNEKGLKPSPHIYCTLINGLGSVMRLTEALKYFELSKASGFPVEVEGPTYNALVGAYCWSMRISEAFRVVNEMKECGVGPNSRTYDIILHHLIKMRRTKEAYSIFERMSDELGCHPTVSTYEIIVRMFCSEDKLDMALKVWDQMKGKGILPGMHMFSTLISSLCDENRLDEACRFFQDMLDVGIRPPGQLFSSLKKALIDAGKEDLVIVLTHKLEKLRKTPLIGARTMVAESR